MKAATATKKKARTTATPVPTSARQFPGPRSIHRKTTAAIWKIKDEGLNRSQVMEVLSYLTDVYGPRLAGSPNIRQAQSYAQDKFREWGLGNIHTERFEFGRGWTLKKFSAHMLEPSYSPLIGYPKAWTPGTNGLIRGEAIRWVDFCLKTRTFEK